MIGGMIGGAAGAGAGTGIGIGAGPARDRAPEPAPERPRGPAPERPPEPAPGAGAGAGGAGTCAFGNGAGTCLAGATTFWLRLGRELTDGRMLNASEITSATTPTTKMSITLMAAKNGRASGLLERSDGRSRGTCRW